jgi:hypothetical protein
VGETFGEDCHGGGARDIEGEGDRTKCVMEGSILEGNKSQKGSRNMKRNCARAG